MSTEHLPNLKIIEGLKGRETPNWIFYSWHDRWHDRWRDRWHDRWHDRWRTGDSVRCETVWTANQLDCFCNNKWVMSVMATNNKNNNIIMTINQYLNCRKHEQCRRQGHYNTKIVCHWLYDFLNRFVFSLNLNCSKDVDVLIKSGKLFQADGPAKEKDRSPGLVFDLWMSWLWAA